MSSFGKRLAIGLIMWVAAFLLLGESLLRLGLMRHGGAPDLHLEWWGSLGAHRSHLGNLLELAIAVVLRLLEPG